MDVFLVVLFVCAFKGLFGEVYVNVTRTGCMSFDSNRDLLNGLVIIQKDSTSVVQSFFNGAKEVLLTTGNFSGRITDYYIDRQEGNLSFCLINTTLYDGGDYSIIFSKTDFVRNKLYVLDMPTKPILNIIKNGTIDSENGMLSCLTDSTSAPAGLPFTYVWSVNDTFILNENKYKCNDKNTCDELIINVDKNDKFNYYKCSATEQYGQTSEFSDIRKIDPKYVPFIHMEPTYNPYIVYHRQQNIVLTCLIDDANPTDVTYNWHSPSGNLNAQNLTISTVNKTHGGQYSCTATNLAGTSNRTTKLINVHHGPLILNIANHQDIIESNSLIVSPIVDAYPASEMIWWTSQNDANFRYNGSVLKINKIHRTLHGNYTCYAKNTLTPSGMAKMSRTTRKTFYVNVQFKPSLDYTRPYSSSHISAAENSTIVMTVTITANPTPTIEWTFKPHTDLNSCNVSAIFPNTTTNEFRTSSSISINEVQSSNYGEYTFIARNIVGILFRRFVLMEEGHSLPPSIVYVVCKSTLAIVIWKHNFNEGRNMDFYVQYSENGQYMNSEKVHMNDTDQPMIYTVTDLNSNRKYQFAILAVNSLSEFKSKTVECLTDASCLKQEMCNLNKELSSMFVTGITTLVVGLLIFTAAVIFLVRNNLKNKASKSSKSHQYTDVQRSNPATTDVYTTLQSDIELRPFQKQSNNTYEECGRKSEAHAYSSLGKLDSESKSPHDQSVNTYEQLAKHTEGHAYCSLYNMESESRQSEEQNINSYEDCESKSKAHAHDILGKMESEQDGIQKKQGVYDNTTI